MKLVICSILLSICFSTLSFSQEAVEKKSPPAGNAIIGDYYGTDVSEISESKAISVEKLENELKNTKKSENVAVKGLVTDVCEKRGCWLTIKTEDGSPFL
ncbi:hypothetical protein D3C85_613060 [compost metagenome]